MILVSSHLHGWRGRSNGLEATRSPLPLVLSTSRLDLNDAEAKRGGVWLQMPLDTAAGVRLAEILLRKARVETDASHAIEAERVLRIVLDARACESIRR